MIGDKLQKVTIIWLILSINITIGGFDLSDADLKCALPAVGTLLVIIGLVLFLLITLGMAATIPAHPINLVYPGHGPFLYLVDPRKFVSSNIK